MYNKHTAARDSSHERRTCPVPHLKLARSSVPMNHQQISKRPPPFPDIIGCGNPLGVRNRHPLVGQVVGACVTWRAFCEGARPGWRHHRQKTLCERWWHVPRAPEQTRGRSGLKEAAFSGGEFRDRWALGERWTNGFKCLGMSGSVSESCGLSSNFIWWLQNLLQSKLFWKCYDLCRPIFEREFNSSCSTIWKNPIVF